jgi:hypothetical protein
VKLRKLLTELTGCDDIRVLKAFIYIARANQINERHHLRLLIKDRILFLLISFCFPLIVRIHRDRLRDTQNVLLEPSDNPTSVQAYSYFIKKNAGLDASPYHWKRGIFIRDTSDLLAILKAWLRIVRISMSVMFIGHNLPMIEIWKFNICMIQMRLDKPRQVYVVDYSNIVSYLLVLSLREASAVFYIPTNSNLDAYMRYGYFQDVSIILTSPLLVEQLDYLQKRGWIKLVNTNVESRGSLFSIYHDQLSKTIKYDLGFFSSGEWARTRGIFNVYVRSEILENLKHSNEFWVLSETVISHLVNFVRANNLKLKIFLHPYERYLISEQEIYPPFVEFVDNKNVFMSADFSANISNFFEARIGVTTISSIVFDRAAYGLETLFYVRGRDSAKLHDGLFYNRDHIKSVSKNAFENIEQLDDNLNSLFLASSAKPLLTQAESL